MKNSFSICIAVICCLLVSGTAYGKNETVPDKVEKAKIQRKGRASIGGVMPSRSKLKQARRDTAQAIVKKIEACIKGSIIIPATDTCGITDCSAGYCAKPACFQQVFCCHRISKEQFDAITERGTLGRAIFSPAQFQNVITGGVCETEKIRCSVRWKTYTIKRVHMDEDVSRPYKSYYSIPMMQQLIGMSGIVSIIMYKGTDVDGKNIVPLEVVFSNHSEYFDLSGLP